MNHSHLQAGISWTSAADLVRVAAETAAGLGINIVASIVDRQGNLIAHLRMPEAYLHSSELAQDKAYTAASFGFPTSRWMGQIEAEERLKLGITTRPRLVILGGGFPLIESGKCLGGIGVSGGSEAEDEKCALAAIAALGLKHTA